MPFIDVRFKRRRNVLTLCRVDVFQMLTYPIKWAKCAYILKAIPYIPLIYCRMVHYIAI